MSAKRYFSLHGSESEGWRLMMYTYVIPPGATVPIDAVTPAWSAPKQFDKLSDAMAELCEHEVIGE